MDEKKARKSLESIVADCLEQRSDGRYYATQSGRYRLQRWLDDNGFKLRAVVTEDERYDLKPL